MVCGVTETLRSLAEACIQRRLEVNPPFVDLLSEGGARDGAATTGAPLPATAPGAPRFKPEALGIPERRRLRAGC